MRAAAALSGLAALAGCASSITSISPSELPALAQSAERNPDGWHATQSPERRPIVLKGKITGLVIQRREVVSGEVESRQDTFKAPFQATYGEGSLLVADAEHERRYSTRELTDVRVRHTDQGARDTTGVALLVASVAPFGLMAYGISAAVSWADVHEPPGPAPAIAVASLFAAAGLGLAIPGVVLLATRPGDPREGLRTSASFAVGPGSAGLRIAF
jgi:hypothetical protein